MKRRTDRPAKPLHAAPTNGSHPPFDAHLDAPGHGAASPCPFTWCVTNHARDDWNDITQSGEPSRTHLVGDSDGRQLLDLAPSAAELPAIGIREERLPSGAVFSDAGWLDSMGRSHTDLEALAAGLRAYTDALDRFLAHIDGIVT